MDLWRTFSMTLQVFIIFVMAIFITMVMGYAIGSCL